MTKKIYLSYYQRNKELISAKVKEYYKNNKDRLSKQAREISQFAWRKKNEKREYSKNRYQNMTEEDKIKRRAYLRNSYYNLPEEKKEYGRKRYYALIKVLQAS